MKNELTVFNSPEFGQLRMIFIEGKQYFVANDVAKALGYSVPKDAVTRHCKGAIKQRYLTEGGEQEIKVIPEGDVYRLIIRSKLPKAEEFEKWVFDEVLPSIRKQGYYSKDDEKQQKLELARQKLELQKEKTKIMELNAKTRAFNSIMKSIEKHQNLSPLAMEVFGLKALESAFGADVGNLLPEVEKTYSATEVGEILGISANKVGRLANANGLKTPEYGRYVADKSKNSDKEVETFRYNETGVKVLQELAW